MSALSASRTDASSSTIVTRGFSITPALRVPSRLAGRDGRWPSRVRILRLHDGRASHSPGLNGDYTLVYRERALWSGGGFLHDEGRGDGEGVVICRSIVEPHCYGRRPTCRVVPLFSSAWPASRDAGAISPTLLSQQYDRWPAFSARRGRWQGLVRQTRSAAFRRRRVI